MAASIGAHPSIPHTQTTYPAAATPTLDVGFEAKRWLIALKPASVGLFYVSFDGINDHAALQGAGVFELHNRAQKVWVRVTGLAGAENVSITAEDSSW